MENDLLNLFSEINMLLKHIEKPLTIHQISKKFNLSLIETRSLLDKFIEQGDTLQKYLFIFSADLKTASGLETLLIPSYSEQLDKVLNDNNLLDLSIYAIWRKLPIVDYSCLYNEPEIIPLLDVKKNINTNGFTKQFNGIKIKETDSPKPVLEFKPHNQETKESDEFYYEAPLKSASNITDVKTTNTNNINTNLNKSNTTEGKDNEPAYETIKANITLESKKRKASQDSSSESVSLKRRREDTSNEKKKILKTRKVKKTKTYVDEKGYLNTIDEWENEEYWSDEKSTNIAPIKSNNNNIETKGKKGAAKKAPTNQASIQSFFKK
jgi:hypothetical protein